MKYGKIIDGNLIIEKGCKDDFSEVEEITGYCIEVNGIYSHGYTIKQAKDDLIYKISNRDTSQYKDLTLDSVVTKAEAIKMYRIITGACEAGTKHFVSGLTKTKAKYKISELIKLTKGQYGNETFKKFFKEKDNE